MTSKECLTIDAVMSLVSGSLEDEAAAAARSHLRSCEACEELAAALAADRVPAPLRPGDRVSRYVIERLVGSGAMGVVYEATDPDLSRRVALKLVRDDAAASDPLHARLKREGQAMAQLSHPNVVAVYDVGSAGENVFVAMELIRGQTLREWQRSPHSIDEILHVYRQAGAGLAAAHRAGVVHRDFKPENVLIGDDGRVAVGDFGLSRASPGEAPARDETATTPQALTLTRTGAALGTPAYMAPEQLAGGAADARSDVFSFAVALYEALYGRRPFAGSTMAELARAVERGLPVAPGANVPRWIAKVLARGLAARSEQRFATMEDILAALDVRARRTRLRNGVLGAAAFVAVVLATTFWIAREPRCDGAEAAWGEVWSTTTKARTRAAFMASGRANAALTFDLLDRALETAHAGWVRAHDDACARRLRGAEPAGLAEKRAACLEEHRRELERFVSLLLEADAAGAEQSPSAIWQMSRLDDCMNERVLAGRAARGRDDLTTALVEARALHTAGRYERALAVAEQAVTNARTADEPRMLALLLIELGLEQQEAFRFADAEDSYHEAAQHALALHDDAVAADAWARLVGLVGYRMERARDAHVLAGYARVAIENLGADPYRRALLDSRLAQVEWWTEANLETAYARYDDARVLVAPLSVLEWPMFAATVHTGVLHDMGRDEDALPAAEDAMFRVEEAFGRDHVEFYYYAANYAEALIHNGGARDAIPLLEELLVRFAELPEGYAAHLLAEAWRQLGDPRRAQAADERALQLLSADLDSLDAAFPWTGLGLDRWMQGDAKGARAALERAAHIRERARLQTVRAETSAALARTLVIDDPKRAATLAREAFAIFTAAANRYGSRIYRARAAALAPLLGAAQP